MKLIDNINHLLGDDLKEHIAHGENARLKIAASYFSIYAFSALKDELEKVDELQFIFTSAAFSAEQSLDKIKKEKREYTILENERSDIESHLYGSVFELHLKKQTHSKSHR